MTYDEILVSLAHAMKSNNGFDWAIAVRNDRSRVLVGRSGSQIDETAGAILGQNAPDLNGQWDVYLSYVPTHMCLGMLWRAQPRDVIYWSTTQIVKRRIDRNNIFPARAYSGADDVDENSENFSPIFDALRPGATMAGTHVINTTLGAIPQVRSLFATAASAAFTGRFRPPLAVQNTLAYTGGTTFFAAGANLVHRENTFMKLVYAMLALGWNRHRDDPAEPADPHPPASRPYGNNIGAVMIDATNNKIVAWGLNMKSLNGSYHAETLMIQEYLRRNGGFQTLPTNCIVYTSLECCHMCAGYLRHLRDTSGTNLTVVYGQQDVQIAGSCLAGSQQPTTDPLAAQLGLLQGIGGQETIPFLFSKAATGAYRQFHGESVPFRIRGPVAHSVGARGATTPDQRLTLGVIAFLRGMQNLGILRKGAPTAP